MPNGAGTSNPTVPAIISATYPLGMIAATLESFSGKDAVRYFEKMEQRSSLDGWSEEQTLKLIKFKLTGEAYNFFKADPTLDTLTFNDLKARFIRKFLPIKLPGEAQLNFSRCYQRQDESVSSYCTRLKSLGAQLLKEDLEGADVDEVAGLKRKNKDILISQFKIGLRKDLLKEVGILLLREPDLDLEKAEQIVKLQETTQMMVHGKEKSSRVFQINQEKKCFQCGKTGHIARECRSGNGQEEEANSYSKSCSNCGKRGHLANECRSGHRREQSQVSGCYNCGKMGHFARECRSAGKASQFVCYSCNKTGHFAKECPEKNKQRNSPGKWEENKRQELHREGQRNHQSRTVNSSSLGNGPPRNNNTGAIPKQPGYSGRASQGNLENNKSLN